MADVTNPNTTDPKGVVNEKLIRIKAERESRYDDSDDETLTQQFRPQHFFKNLDDNLNSLFMWTVHQRAKHRKQIIET